MRDITALSRIYKIKKKMQAFCDNRYDREFDIIITDFEWLMKELKEYRRKEIEDLHPHLKSKGL
ncbi:hypothetical protein M0R19_05585 [Candidatus Pacearchaeota archaeon]|jgi:uncharacterized protein (DUF1697 family)|nr:hypothetical protein [Candidatus Pacearchaeota archaeon]